MKKIEKVPYRVDFKYYQYNTGRADNGTYSWHEEFYSLQKARQFKKIVDRAYEAKQDNEYENHCYVWGTRYVESIAPSGFINSKATITLEIKTKIFVES